MKQFKIKKYILLSVIVIIILAILFFPYTKKIQHNLFSINRDYQGNYSQGEIVVNGTIKSSIFRDLYKFISGKDFNENDFWQFRGLIIPKELMDKSTDKYFVVTNLQNNSNGEKRYLQIYKNEPGETIHIKTLSILANCNLNTIILLDDFNLDANYNKEDIPFWQGTTLNIKNE